MKRFPLGFFLIIIITGLASCNRPADSATASSGKKNGNDTILFFTPEQMNQALLSGLDSVVKSKASTLVASRILGPGTENTLYILGIRTGPGLVEMHELWDDIAIIRSGHGMLKTGLHVDGNQKQENKTSGNWLGGIIREAKESALSPGDFIIIPAGLAHQYIPAPGDSLTYWTIKVRRPKM